jgi:RNA polymerase sigma factor (TIGR02999 family)
MPETPGEITELLQAAAGGDAAAESRLVNLVYPELLRLARGFMQRERAGHTLQPTALVNEVYLRLAGNEAMQWKNRAQFFAMAATLMRRILVDHARERRASKRAGGRQQVDLDSGIMLTEDRIDEVILVDDALTKLEGLDQRQSRIVELRFFGGLTEEEIAGLLGISLRTVKRDWSFARAWLRGEFCRPDGLAP